jgi:ADP-ribose pyrophosphatase YjhB (NUDIX family)
MTMRYYDVNQDPWMVTETGVIYRLAENNKLERLDTDHALSEAAIELTESAFMRRFSNRLAEAFILELDADGLSG